MLKAIVKETISQSLGSNAKELQQRKIKSLQVYGLDWLPMRHYQGVLS